ncbi:unnamed protein product (mitochondrion) [Plasmodiophora brassicae]|uniref:Uncharacterized protein n=1 Tax=Plasmodiophora brassicae TaxID=37360 RepID=A0A0G4IK04_PLABS|nr:hypothetical protein PBRA_004235 [Plasmodiophora brassicae]SPR00383.1 unnamed protein product [Plasmodiophora brassicae]
MGDSEPAPAAIPRSIRLGSASFGALLTSILCTPLDVVKTRLQSQMTGLSGGGFTYRFSNGLNDGELWCHRCNQPQMIRASESTFMSMFRLVRSEGFTTLWRGLGPTLAQSIPSTVIYFASYDEMRETLMANAIPCAPALSGAIARTGAATMVSPIELVRTRVMAHRGRPESAFSLVSNVVKETVGECRVSGIRVLFQGLPPTLFRDIPFSAIYWSGFEMLRPRLRHLQRYYASEMTPLQAAALTSFGAGTMSGAFAAAVTTPFDVIKVRRQVARMNNAPAKSTLTLLREILHGEGVGSLFVGLAPRVAKVAPACAIMISSYEVGKMILR